ncbi:MFS general substrate transporter [Choiromyces venosus 120613-1]|uniref:MFS general substrate transporter n=1 Tax=Choiromyces venosus 120613-1 TaxID=1336337 RepID=A0A3N4K5V6_9PEZI|nr:MFS general substrate transporter [Choiromyces venosus 120613-1]
MATTPLNLTLTPAGTGNPRFPPSPTSSNDQFSSAAEEEEGYELRTLSRAPAATDEDEDDNNEDNERGALIPDQEAARRGVRREREDVLYETFQESEGEGEEEEEDSMEIRRRERRRGKKEFFYSAAQERAVVRRLDWCLVLFLAVLYMLSFLDRSNIGNARIAGMTEDLELEGDNYEWLLTAFYVTYISFEWMTLCWKVFPAHKYIPFCVAGWGFVACMQGLAINWGTMLALRALLGITEAAFGPGVPFYLSFFYRREELALRTGLFVSAAPLATAYAGFLAYGITSIPSPIAPWRLLFILEGFPSMVMAIVSYYHIPDSPADAGFLTLEQKKIARRRLLVVRDGDDEEEVVMGEEESRGVRWGQVWSAVKDVGNWATAFMFFFCNVSFSSLPVFLPTILKDMGYTSIHAQALSAPPYLFAFFLVLLSTYLSDRLRSRSYPILLLSLVAALGYFTLAATSHIQSSLASAITHLDSEAPANSSFDTWITSGAASSWLEENATGALAIKYVSIFLAAGGIFSAIALTMVWNVNNSESESGRGAGMAILQVVGQCGPLVGTRLYPEDEGPYYVRGMAVCGAAMMAVVLLVGLQRWRLNRANRERDRKEAKEGRVGRGWRFML